jgi:hypothetical protein
MLGALFRYRICHPVTGGIGEKKKTAGRQPFNNAGIMTTKSLADTDDALFDRTFAINVRGTFLALREATKRLRRGGRIINFSTSATMMRRLPRKKPRPDLTGTMSVATHRYRRIQPLGAGCCS